MVKVTIECDGKEPMVLIGEFAWGGGAVSTKEDDGISSNSYLVGNTSVSMLATDMAKSLSRISSNATYSKLEKVAFLAGLMADVMFDVSGITKEEAVENAY